MRLEFHPEAELELLDAVLHYELEIAGLGERLGAEVRYAADLLLRHPEIGQTVALNLRRFVLPTFPFTLYYSAGSEGIRVEAVAHQSRQPGYWPSRLHR